MKISFFRNTLFLLLALISSISFAVDNLPSDSYDDYDQSKYQRIYDDAANRHYDAQQAVNQAEQNLAAARAEETRLRGILDDINRTIYDLQRDEQNSLANLDAARREQQRLNGQMRVQENRIRDIQRNLQGENQRLKQAEQREAELKKQVVQSKQQLETLDKLANNAKKSYDEKNSAAQNNQKAIEALQTQINQSINAKNQAQTALTNLQTQLTSAQAEKQTAQDDLQLKQNYKNTLQQNIQGIQADITSLQQQIQAAQAANNAALVAQLQAQLAQKQQALQAAQTELTSVNSSIQTAQNRLNTATTKVTNLQQQIQSKTTEIANLEIKIQQANTSLTQKQAAQPGLNTEAQKAKQISDDAARAAQQQKNRHDDIVKQFNEAKSRADRLADSVRGIERNLQKERRDLAEMENRYRYLENYARDMENRIYTIRSNLQAKNRDRDAYTQAVNQAESTSRQKDLERTNAITEMQAADQDRLRKLARLQDVQTNVEDARVKMKQLAGSHGSLDGDREGREFGEADGKRVGISDGTERGRAAGIAEGKDKFYKMGYAVGKNRGIKKGQDDAEAKGESDGKLHGTEQGRVAGLIVAYREGKQEGLKEGATNGSDKVAYGKGRKQGEAEGLARAQGEAQAQEPIGYKNKENEFLNAPLKEVVIGDDTIAKGFEGVQAAGAGHGDGRYYNPRPNTYPHPVITQFYQQYYDQFYRETLDNTYSRTYTATYDAYYAENFEKLRADYAAREYPDDRKQGDSDAYAKFYRETYDIVYPISYAERRQHYYNIAFEIARVDVPEYKRGFNDGNAIASEEKGLNEGREYGYRTNIELEKKLAYERGVAAANKRYMENPVIQIVGSNLTEQNRDGIHMPGENVATEVVIKNFGLQAKKTLRAITQISGRGINNPATEVAVAEIPGQSITTVKGLGATFIKENIAEGTNFSLSLALKDSDNRVVHQNAFTAQVQYPSAFTVQGFDGVLVPGVNTKLRLQITNRSKKEQNLLVNIDIDGNKVDVLERAIPTGTIMTGSNTVVEFSLTGKPEANFETAPISVLVTQAGERYAKEGSIAATVIRKHQVNPNALGLILSGDLSRGGGKNLFASASLDTWDLRVDGLLANASTLDPYVGKVVHLMADKGLSLDSASAANLQSYIRKGGSLIVWGTSLQESGILTQLGSLMGITSASTLNISSNLNANKFLKGMKLEYQGEVSSLRLDGVRSVPALKDSRGSVIAALSHANEFTNSISRIVTIGLSAEGLELSIIKDILSRMETLKLSIEKKIEIAKKDQEKLYVVIDEVIEEINDDDIRTDIRYFDDNGKESKLMKTIKTLLEKDDNNNSRDAFIKSYLEVYTFIQAMKDWRNRDDIMHIIEWTSVGGWFSGTTWKDAYCSKYGDNDSGAMCQRPGDNNNGG